MVVESGGFMDLVVVGSAVERPRGGWERIGEVGIQEVRVVAGAGQGCLLQIFIFFSAVLELCLFILHNSRKTEVWEEDLWVAQMSAGITQHQASCYTLLRSRAVVQVCRGAGILPRLQIHTPGAA